MDFQRLTDITQIQKLIQDLNTQPQPVILDLETVCSVVDCVSANCKHALDPRTARISEVVISGREHGQVFIFSGDMLQVLKNLHVMVLVLHNFKFDFKMLRAAGIDPLKLFRKLYDTMLLDHLNLEVDFNYDIVKSHALDTIVQERYNDPYKEVFWGKYKQYAEAPEAEQVEYACKDVYYTQLAYFDLMADLAMQQIPDSLIQQTHELALALWETEVKGIPWTCRTRWRWARS
jgi:hypothetical protein